LIITTQQTAELSDVQIEAQARKRSQR